MCCFGPWTHVVHASSVTPPFITLWQTQTLIDEPCFEGLSASSSLSALFVPLADPHCSPSPPRCPPGTPGRPCPGSAPWARRLWDITCVRRGCHLCVESPISWPSRASAGKICVCLMGKAPRISPGIEGGWGGGSAGWRLCRLTGDHRGQRAILQEGLGPALVDSKRKKPKIRKGTWPILSPDLCINWKTKRWGGILSNLV